MEKTGYTSPSLNLSALPLVQEILRRSEALKISSQTIAGATVIDCGVEERGGWEAGLMLASVCLGGLARVRMVWSELAGLRWPFIEVWTDHPVPACMLSQYAGWFIEKGEFSAMGSGPGRAVLAADELFDKLGCRDEAASAIFVLETGTLPTEEAVVYMAEKCERSAKDLYLLVAPTSSPAGAVQIAARSVETGLHQLLERGYDIRRIREGWGCCPLPPLAKDDAQAMGRTNDAILYGATVHYNLEDDDEVLVPLIQKLPSCASRDYGKPFAELLKRYGNFYDIDPDLFSPAQVYLSNQRSGRTHCAGQIRTDILKGTFDLQTY